MRLETLAVHAGRGVDPTTGAVTPAIHPSTTFEREPDGSYPRGFLYARNANPTRNALEDCLAALEGGAAAAAFASGSAATSAVLLALQPGDHVIAPTDVYHGTARLLRETFSRWGLETTFVDMTDAAAVRRAVKSTTRLVWVETPSNPLWKVTDIAAIGEIARAAGARYVCDNTTATPVLQSPFRLGADLVVHATTKFLGGHGDVTGGAVVTKTRDPFFETIRAVQATGGAVPSPFDCWLVLRGLRTLPCRIRAHSEHALRVATFLARHARVEAVHYPGLPAHPGHDVARRQMAAFGGMVSVEVRGDRARALEVAARGIGLAIASRFIAEGARVALIDIDHGVEGAAKRLGDQALGLTADVTVGAEVERVVASAHRRWGRLDVVVNNAGITGGSKLTWEVSDEEWQRVLAVDLTSVFLVSRAAVRIMLGQGSGRIVNIASIAGKEGNPTLVPYSTAKAGVIGFTKALAKEVATRGILVNAVAPAVIGTDMVRQMSRETVDMLVAKIPMGRIGRPEEVAALVTWLASDECSFSTGAVYDLSGGRATY